MQHERRDLRESGLRDQDRVHGLLEEMGRKDRGFGEKLAELQDEVLEWKTKYGQVEAGARMLFGEKNVAVDEVGRLRGKNAELEASLLRLLEVTEGCKERSVEIDKNKGDILGHAVTLMERVRGLTKQDGEAEARACKITGGIASRMEKERKERGLDGKAKTMIKDEDMESPIVIPIGAQQASVHETEELQTAASDDEIPPPSQRNLKKLKETGNPLQAPSPSEFSYFLCSLSLSLTVNSMEQDEGLMSKIAELERRLLYQKQIHNHEKGN